MKAGTGGGSHLVWINLQAFVMCLVSMEQSNLRKSGVESPKRSYWVRSVSTSSASLARKACSNASVRMEMMWSDGAGGLVVFLGGGVVPNS